MDVSHATPTAQSCSDGELRSIVSEPAWLDQTNASQFLASLGVKRAPRTLQKQRVTGGGPPFRRIGTRVMYEREPLRAWAVAQRSPLVTSTSELPSRVVINAIEQGQ